MAASFAVKRGTTVIPTVFNKLLNPIRSVCATPSPSFQRCCFNSRSSSEMTANYDDDNRNTTDVDVDRRSDTSVSRRRDRDNDLFSDMLDPFSSPRSLNQIFNMMDEFMGGGFAARRGRDVKEDNESLNFRFEMPGIDKDDVNICVEHNTLVVRAEAEKETEDEEPRRRYSTRIDLPMNAYKVDEIKAELKNGVLKVRVPKVKEEDRKDVRQIQVE